MQIFVSNVKKLEIQKWRFTPFFNLKNMESIWNIIFKKSIFKLKEQKSEIIALHSAKQSWLLRNHLIG